MVEPLLIIFIAIALLFDFLNGFHDSANVVATTIASSAMSPRAALSISALTNFIGPFLFGVAVATTIGTEVVSEEAVTVPTAMAALLSAIIWNLITWWFGIPSSSSHALIGGFVGAALIGFGITAIQIEGLTKVLLALFISPILGFIFGFIILAIILWIGRGFSPRINEVFRKGQWITTITRMNSQFQPG
jgi:PiT family inorganic phosphate transporter